MKWLLATGIALLTFASSTAIAQAPTSGEGNAREVNSQVFTSGKRQQRSLRLTITVDDPSHLKVKEGDEIREGQTISDNSNERARLLRQKKSVQLQIQNLKSKNIPKPAAPKQPPPLKSLPPADFTEQEAAIAQAQLKLSQSKALLQSKTPILVTDNTERRAEVEKAESALQLAWQKSQEQEQLLQSMKDMQIEVPVIRHEQAKLEHLQLEHEQAQSALKQARAKLNTAGIVQQQELKDLEAAVQLAQSEFQVTQSQLATAQNDRKLLEYKASIDTAQRAEQENQSKQNYSKQEQDYAQQMRERDYQLAQLNISLSAIEDKISQISVVRSPRNGYIKRVKPWVGSNGKYTTVITISSNPRIVKPFTKSGSSGTSTNTSSGDSRR